MRSLIRTPAALALIALILFLPAFPTPARAQIPVTDVAHIAISISNLIQQIAQYAEMVLDYTEQVAHYYMLVKQYEWMLKNLDNIENPLYFQLFGWWGNLLELLRDGEALGHSIENLRERFTEQFPGPEVPPFDVRYQDKWTRRAQATHDTLLAVLMTTQKLGDLAHTFEFNINKFNERANAAEGERQQSAVTHMQLTQISEQMTAVLEMEAAAANQASVYYAHLLQDKSDEQLAWQEWFARYEPNLYNTLDRGHTGIPGTGHSTTVPLP